MYGGTLRLGRGEFLSQPLKVDAADVVGCAFIANGFLRHNSFVHDLLQFTHDIRDVCICLPLLKAHVDDANRRVFAAIAVHASKRDARLELGEARTAQHLEALACLVVLVRGLLRRVDGRILGKTVRFHDRRQRSAMCFQPFPYQSDRLVEFRQQVLLRFHGISLAAFRAQPARSPGKGRQCLTQVLENAAVIDDQAVVLALVHAVRAGNGLHERVRLERLVEIERTQGRHVEPRQPHGANDGDAEGMLLRLEGLVNIHAVSPHILQL